MRFIAAFAVFLYHVTMLGPSNPHGIGLLDLFADEGVRKGYEAVFRIAGFTGVSFFFVLSGFVLTWSARPTDPLTGFWRRRFFKIYPLHLVTYVAGLLLLTGTAFRAANDLPGLFLIQSWSTNLGVVFAANSPSWSIACEVLFYLLFPVLLPLIARIPARRLVWWIAGMVSAMLAVVTIAYHFVPAGYQLWFTHTLPPLRLMEFVLGILAARLVILGRWPSIGLLPSAVLLIAAYVVSLQLPQVFAQTLVTIVPILLVIGAGAMADIQQGPGWLRGRVMVWLGEVSFAFYLVHLIVLMTVRKWVGPTTSFATGQAVLLLLGCVALTTVVAWLLHAFVEKPVMRHWSVARSKR
jgi:peptidoglycan/LPS O-acetylase OafA/YrhL